MTSGGPGASRRSSTMRTRFALSRSTTAGVLRSTRAKALASASGGSWPWRPALNPHPPPGVPAPSGIEPSWQWSNFPQCSRDASPPQWATSAPRARGHGCTGQFGFACAPRTPEVRKCARRSKTDWIRRSRRTRCMCQWQTLCRCRHRTARSSGSWVMCGGRERT